MSLELNDPTTTRKTTRKITITKSAIDALKAGGVLRDDRVPGLQVRARASTKSFMLYYRTRTGGERRPRIGDATVLSVADARAIARGLLTRVAAGEDPSADREAERTAATMDDLWQRCAIEHYWDVKGKSSHRDAASAYRRYIAPLMGKQKVASIDAEDVEKLKREMSGVPIQFNRTKAVLSKMLRLAIKYKMRPGGPTPCAEVEGNKEHHRRRYAKRAELAAIGAAMARLWLLPENRTGIAFMYVMAFTGARPTEIGRATPDMVERVGEGEGVLRIPEGKNGDFRDVYLPPQAMRILDALPTDRTTLVGRATVPHELWKEIVTEAGCPDLWLRDFRRTFASVGMSQAGLSKDVVGGLLGHKSEQTTAIYARLTEHKAHRAAADTANEMDLLLSAAA